MRRLRKCHPSVESMESKRLLSTISPPLHTVEAAHLAVADAVRLMRINGRLHGRFTTHQSLPDMGGTTLIFGTGDLQGLGKTLIAGGLRSAGFVAYGHATGSITLLSKHGSLMISLTGPTQSGPSSLPTTLNYQVTKGTGAYRNVSDQGTVELVITPSKTPNGGTFTLRFHSGASAV